MTQPIHDPPSIHTLLRQMNAEDQRVPLVVAEALPQIAVVVGWAVQALSRGGHLHYFGAGTSGRLAGVDAMECAPTFGVPATWVHAHIAGGFEAFGQADESLEDRADLGSETVRVARIHADDLVIGVSASGTTPFVVGALTEARRLGARTVALVCRDATIIPADLVVNIVVGPEIVRGSTRLKAGTAEKLVLNMISTATFAEMGYVYEGWMVGVQPANQKLWKRAVDIVHHIACVSALESEAALRQCDGDVRAAIVMLSHACSADQARQSVQEAHGNLRVALERSAGGK